MAGAPSQGTSWGAYRLVRRIDEQRRCYLVRRRDDEPRFDLYLRGLPSGSMAEAEIEIERYAAIAHVALHRVVDWLEVDGTLALVFEHVEGVRLDRLKGYLDRDGERLPDAAVWFLVWRMLSALGKTHLARNRLGELTPIVHGRLNPRDMIVSWTGEVRVTGMCPYLADLEPAPARSWLAPELRRGDAPSAKSDTYATALIARSLLTGRPPPSPGASLAPLAKLRPDVPADVARALDRALHHEPARRPSCPELAQRLEGLVRITEGRAALRECMELYRALWGLWSVASPERFSHEGEALAKALEAHRRSRALAERAEEETEPSAAEPSAVEPSAEAIEEAPVTSRSAGLAVEPAAPPEPDEEPEQDRDTPEVPELDPVQLPEADGSPPPPPPSSGDSPAARSARDEALTWRWVAFAALAVAAAAIAWHRVHGDDVETAAAAPSAQPAPARVPKQPADGRARPASSAVAPTVAASSSAPARSPRWPRRRVSNTGVKPGELLVDEGYLVVESRVDALVFANGVAVGKTNQRNKARCRFKFVRLGRGPGKWISEGVTVDIACGAVTTVRLDPSDTSGKVGDD